MLRGLLDQKMDLKTKSHNRIGNIISDHVTKIENPSQNIAEFFSRDLLHRRSQIHDTFIGFIYIRSIQVALFSDEAVVDMAFRRERQRFETEAKITLIVVVGFQAETISTK